MMSMEDGQDVEYQETWMKKKIDKQIQSTTVLLKM